MAFFKDQWDSENYPSSEDYLEAKRNGTFNQYKAYIDKPSNAKPDTRRFDSRTSTEAKTKGMGSRHLDPQPKPFGGGMSMPKTGKGSFPFKFIVFLIALVMGFLPALTSILDSVTDKLNLEELLPNGQQVTESVITETAESELPLSKITTALPSDYFVLHSPTDGARESGSAEIDGLGRSALAALNFGTDSGDKPFYDLKLDNAQLKLLEASPFMKSADASMIFDEEGRLVEGASIELVITDLTNDGLKELLLYFTNGVDYPFVEVFYNTGEGPNPFKALEYFGSYEDLNITSEGIMQRIDESGNVYDEIETTPDGVFLLEGGN